MSKADCALCRMSTRLCVNHESEEQAAREARQTLAMDKLLLDDIDNLAEGCTEWEGKFISDCMTQTGMGEILSPDQRKKAEQIWKERTYR